MKVSEFIKLLQEKNQDAEVQVITTSGQEGWKWSSNPKVKSHKNSFGETVWID